MLDTDPHAHVSAVTPWELSVRQALGRLDSPADPPERSAHCRLKPLPVTAEHAMRAGRLSLQRRDPFDRMLVAQARAEESTISTCGVWIPKYDVRVLRV
ncbi:hypothetical protein BJP40_17665 [Streptomyces sp. CC53]|nr:hypothetical protein BJP40_17665 [Streptomyces sp. CC53]